MKNYSANLYRKFKTRTLNTLNGDDFYDYFMRVIESGERYYGQKNEALIKVIDEEWVRAIENCLIPMENIIKKPRKFIRREESIVPVELAKKVGADAVKHLITHTQLISRVDQYGDIIPKKILNVYNEESYDIYENRFVITLLHRIGQFLDKRYSALFETTGDEFASVLKVDSTFNDNDEKVEYSLVLKLHQGQGYLDSRSNDPLIYQRIEHIKTMLSGFNRSEFFQSLAGCSKVRSPVSKTNLLMKDPNFKKCYDLWQFMDSYAEVGYSIEMKEYDGDFEEQYLDELNTLMLFNYLIMKNNLANEHNKPVDVINFKKKRILKPKFIHQVIEDFVYDFDVPEIELRQIFNEEIAKAYSKKDENEGDIIAAIERALSLETQKSEREFQKDAEKVALEKQRELEQLEKEKEKQRLAKEKQKQKELAAKALEKEKLTKKKQKEKALLEQEREKQRLINEKQRQKEQKARALAKDKLAKQLLREKTIKAKEKEKERLVKERLKQKELLAKAKEKERIAKEKQKQKDMLLQAGLNEKAKPKANKGAKDETIKEFSNKDIEQ